MSIFIQLYDTMLILDARSFQCYVRVFIPTNRGVPVLEVVERDPSGVDILVNPDQVGLVRVQDYTQTWIMEST